MRVLVVYASRHGATSGIAERLAAVLTAEGLAAEIHPVSDARIIERDGHLDRYDAFVIGSAVYAFHWIGEARDFVRHNLDLLRLRPVWLFGSGPLGDKTTDDKGHDLLKPPPEMAELAERVQARDSRIFFGAWDPDAKPIGVMERVMHVIPAAKDALPAGDFRNWHEIEGWARSIARDLAAIPVPA